jgi:hypothetical protein
MIEQIIQNGEYLNGNRRDLIGLSTDTKPSTYASEELEAGSTFHEADTNKDFIYTNNTWYEY